MDPFQKEFLRRHNELRALHGVPSLAYDTQIAKSAQVRLSFFFFRLPILEHKAKLRTSNRNGQIISDKSER